MSEAKITEIALALFNRKLLAKSADPETVKDVLRNFLKSAKRRKAVRA